LIVPHKNLQKTITDYIFVTKDLQTMFL